MATKADMFNIAMLRLGSEFILDPSDMETKRGRACNKAYDILLPRLLSSYDWSFARKIRTLAATTEESDAYTYVYNIPSDCIRPVKCEDNPISEWVVSNGKIETDITPFYLRYTFKQELTGMYSPHFVEAIGKAIAVAISRTMRGKPASSSMIKEANVALALAQETDADTGYDGKLDGNDPSNYKVVYPDGVEEEDELPSTA